MLDFSDAPYQFVPPKPNRFIIGLARFANRHFVLPGKNHRVDGIDLRGAAAFAEAKKQKGARFVLLPNHPTHSDPQVMTEVCRRLRVKPAFMAAYDVFARGKFGAWFMQHTGAFSVDREGSDRKSLKCAAELLEAGKYPLIICPEGNVYLRNDSVTPFAEGAAYIALRAQKNIGAAAPVFAVPISLKFSYVDNPREAVLSDLADIGTSFDAPLDREPPITEELKRISIAALGRYLKQHGHIPPESNLLADDQIGHAARQIIESLESKIGLSPKPADDLTTRVRKIRAAVHGVRIDPEREIDHRAASHWADEAMLTLRILGYSGGYAAENPSVDRVAETVARLREDVSSKCHPPYGKRHALVKIGTPIDLRSRIDAFNQKSRDAVRELTATCESASQSGVDELNAKNDRLGSQSF
jgi:1-acyl-sn-glycerol-3-phosphate acyltransferase